MKEKPMFKPIELFDQPDFVCIECPLAECDEESLFCAFRWATFPNREQQKAMTMRQARYRRKIKAKPRTEYFRKRYQEKKRPVPADEFRAKLEAANAAIKGEVEEALK